MARNFESGSSERIALALGSAQALTGATYAAIVQVESDGAAKWILRAGPNSGSRYGLSLGATGTVRCASNADVAESTSTVTAADGWCFVCTTKSSGSSTPRAHIYKYATRTWTHENMDIAIGDTTGTPTVGLLIGATNASTPAQFWDGDIAVVGYWETGTAPTDQQVEALAYGFMPWLALPQPRGMWILDQASTSMKVADLTGGGANETALTGTTVSTSAVPVWNRGAAPVTVIRPAGAPTVPGVAAATFSFTGTASGTPTHPGAATASLGFTAAAAGTRTTHGTAAGAYTFTGTASGTRTTAGTTVSNFTFTATAVGARQISGAAASSFTFTGTASGTPTHPGAAAAAFVFTATGSGTVTHPATAAANFTFTATAAGTKTVLGTAAASFGFTAAATGTPTTFGSAAGSFTFLGVASGNRLVYGTANGVYVFTATSTGGAAVVTRNATSTPTAAPKATSSPTDSPHTTSTVTVTARATSTATDTPQTTSAATVTKAATSTPTDSDG